MDFETLFYAEDILDRNHLIRKNETIIRAHLKAHNAQFIVHWQGKHLFYNHEKEVQAYFGGKELSSLAKDNLTLFLGIHEDRPVFGVDFNHSSQPEIYDPETNPIFEEIRSHAGQLDNKQATLLAYSKAMFTWHQNHQYCGRCGSLTKSASAGHERQCQNRACGATHFPRIDPAVIVLVHRAFEDGINRCLLARHKRSGPGRYSTLAGFAEPGETLEMTVKREMFEEAGIQVDNIHYVASQPWPFPSSIMIGFFAEALNSNLLLDQDELKEAHWFTANELRDKSESGEMVLSGVDSIANFLIRHWMKSEGVDIQKP